MTEDRRRSRERVGSKDMEGKSQNKKKIKIFAFQFDFSTCAGSR